MIFSQGMADELTRLLSLSEADFLDTLGSQIDSLLESTSPFDPLCLYTYLLSQDQ